ncbi:MAG TPA: SemiSWEET transporter [Vitreimonas sp.]|uniref:SemiSWEET family sugar transporter n=1 Tax=Vitreimonas sp. TaxID=3069702 RepID=UPI002D57F808|nr:SemiSWEET transporter [Vitreimonas sp.]HYD86390.1 SemiSWEET transporter [Vitreimonas sp.]
MDGAPLWLINTFGVVAGLCSMTSFVPQIWKISRTRDATGVSLRMYAVTIVGFICWTVFGVLSQSWPVTLANAICLVLVSIIFVLRLRFGGGSG